MQIKSCKTLSVKCKKSIILLIVIPALLLGTGNAFASSNPQQEKKPITGKVTEKSGNSLPGVSVYIKGSSSGTITDLDGNYTIEAASSDVIVFSFVGYLTEETTVGNQVKIDITLIEDIIGLDEVIVTGYGVQKKSDVTGSIASVSGEKLAEMPVASIDQALQGKAAGVNIVAQSGRPGESAIIQIRGIGSINTIDPLIIIDGIRSSASTFSNLNINDVESIEILKDASSAAIYGASGGNGVILVTTKKGKSGKITTNFNFFTGVEVVAKKLELMNSEEWLSTAEEQSPSDIAITSRPDTFPNYDWQDYIFEPANTQNYDLSFRGGSEKSTFLISTSYNKQDGIIRNSDYARFTLRVNSEHQVTKRLSIDEKVFYTNSTRKGFGDHLWHEYYDGPIRPVYQMVPFVPDYLPDGDWANAEDDSVNSTANNPLAKFDMINRTQRDNYFEANFGAKLEIIKGLTITSKIGGSIGISSSKEYQGEFFNTLTDRRMEQDVKLIGQNYQDNSYTFQNFLTYNFKLVNNFNFNIVAGMEAIQQWGEHFGGQRNAIYTENPNLHYFDVSEDQSSTNQIITGNGYKGRTVHYFGRLNLDYMGKYLITTNISRDEGSSFGPQKRVGYFPSVSLGWKFTEEAFMENQEFIKSGKIRWGYGETGAYPFTPGATPYLSLIRMPEHFGYAFDNSLASVGAAPVKIENPELHWETMKMQNFGVDLGLLNNKLVLTAEYYSKVNDGMIMVMDVPYVAGTYSMGAVVDGDVTSPTVNMGSIKNSGLEFSAGYRKMEGNLKGSFDVNLATVKNEILELASDSMLRGAVHNISPVTINRVGGSISEFYGWEIDGMFRSQPEIDAYKNADGEIYQPNAKPGDAKFKDVNGDGKVLTTADKVMLGSPIPKLIFGFSFNLMYKDFDFMATFNGTWGNKAFNGMKQYLYYYQGTPNHGKDFANRFVENDIVKNDPITGEPVTVVRANQNTDLYRNAAVNYAKPTNFYVEDASYLRLRNITLGYTFPTALTQKIQIEKFRIYVGAKNLLTWTKYSGTDPESGFYDDLMVQGVDVGKYPSTKFYHFGANLTF